MANQPFDLKDKNGTQLYDGALIYGTMPSVPGRHHFSLTPGQDGISVDMFSCTYGYVHNVKQSDLVDYVHVGLFTEHEDLWCKC